MPSSQINPLIAKTPQEKMNVVCALAKRCFDGGVRLYIYTSEWKIAEYVNQLLWVHPKESFIPHAITREEIAVPIAIGM
ncbi:MAG: DNA polymerase III subunit chi [Chlamydiia bacterium]|nr:DNA polymerase III subunit chi [Chlamydiia bacterium]